MCPPPEEPADDSLNSDLQHINRSVLSLTVYLGCVLHDVCYVKFLPLYVFSFSLRVVLLKRRELREIRCLPLIKNRMASLESSLTALPPFCPQKCLGGGKLR